MTVSERWQGIVNQIFYLTNYAHDLTDDDAKSFAERMIEHDFFPEGPAAYREAITAALAANSGADFEAVPTGHAPAALREFLGKVAAALDERRPWPPPRFVMLAPAEWASFAHGKAIARIDWSTVRLGQFLRALFRPYELGETSLPVLVFRIGTGQTLAFLGSADPTVHSVTLFEREPGDANQTIADFCEQTGFDPAEITKLAA
ncbi:MAG: hypothetical protein HOV76_26880 [Hamadaea sp.]|nr:hypothetical protein [Hamadaea sp.]